MANTLLTDTVKRSLAFLSTPVSGSANAPVIGAPQNLATVITNTGTLTTTFSVTATLPSSVGLVAAQPQATPAVPLAVVNGTTPVTWALSLPPGQSSTLAMQVSSLQAGGYTVPVVVQASVSGQPSISQTVIQAFTLNTVTRHPPP